MDSTDFYSEYQPGITDTISDGKDNYSYYNDQYSVQQFEQQSNQQFEQQYEQQFQFPIQNEQQYPEILTNNYDSYYQSPIPNSFSSTYFPNDKQYESLNYNDQHSYMENSLNNYDIQQNPYINNEVNNLHMQSPLNNNHFINDNFTKKGSVSLSHKEENKPNKRVTFAPLIEDSSDQIDKIASLLQNDKSSLSHINQDHLNNQDRSNKSPNVTNRSPEDLSHHISHINEEKKENKLDKLITIIEAKIKTKDKFLSKIKDPKMLLTSLKEFQAIIGMNTLKDNVGMQTMQIIDAINKGNVNKIPMLNTVLYGSPGVGKSTVAMKLAKIWQSLGFLEQSKRTNSLVDKLKSIPSQELISYFMIIVVVIQTIISFYHSLGTKLFIISVVVLLIVLALLYYYLQKDINKTELTEDEKDMEIVKVVSRTDLVDIYLGGSANKTKNLCDASVGKVLFFDEAYSLVEDIRDPYGKEALDTLNLYMSQHPNLIVIFAGYEEKLRDTIFYVQPGLPSRCMWHFHCDEYSGKELSEIFFMQLNKVGVKYDKELIPEVTNIIIKNREIFVGSGRDTRRLVNYIESTISGRNFGTFPGEKSDDGNKMTVSDVYTGIEMLKTNNITKGKTGNISPEERIIRELFSRNRNQKEGETKF